MIEVAEASDLDSVATIVTDTGMRCISPTRSEDVYEIDVPEHDPPLDERPLRVLDGCQDTWTVLDRAPVRRPPPALDGLKSLEPLHPRRWPTQPQRPASIT